MTAADEHQQEDGARDELVARAAHLDQPANPSGQREPPPEDQGAAEYALGHRERTPGHDAAVDGVGHGGPIAPDPVSDDSPTPTASAAPGPGGDLPPPEHDPAVHFLE